MRSFLGTRIYKIGGGTAPLSSETALASPSLAVPPSPPPGRIKVLGVQAATDSYIYTFRGFSISRFVECTRPGLTPPRRGAARRAVLQITSGGFVSVRSCGGVRYVPGCQARLRKSPSARRDAPFRARIPRILMPGFDCEWDMSLTRAPTDFRPRLRINGDEMSFKPVSGNRLLPSPRKSILSDNISDAWAKFCM